MIWAISGPSVTSNRLFLGRNTPRKSEVPEYENFILLDGGVRHVIDSLSGAKAAAGLSIIDGRIRMIAERVSEMVANYTVVTP
jgi:hypothetical protein